VEACITGSSLLGYIEGESQDIDIFCYDQPSFIKLLYTLHFDPMFLILDKLEKWKFSDITKSKYNGSLKKLGLCTIKFVYNTCISVNVIYKEKCENAFAVISSFDLDLITKAYDLTTKQTLDLSGNSFNTKIVSWNKWNTSFYNPNIWAVSKILRQFERVIKYWNRGYNTDAVTLKYIELLQGMLEYENIFTSDKMDEKMLSVKTNAPILIKILEQWLATHSITDTELELIKSTIKNL
jgi:hypothetical protein